jgi:hypothetical protein
MADKAGVGGFSEAFLSDIASRILDGSRTLIEFGARYRRHLLPGCNLLAEDTEKWHWTGHRSILL